MSVARSKRSAANGGFLDRYTPDERYLLKPSPAIGQPGILEATSPNRDAVLIRVWPRKTQEDEDLQDIWRHELRQLHRLTGYPGAQRLIARVVDAGMDQRGFYIVLDAGQRRPLETFLERGRGSADWLRALKLPTNRFRLWSNFKRVAQGLEILHNEGLVHRNLDGWAILTSAGDDPDFQLTGFEWSLRLMTTSDTPKRGRAPSVPSISFAEDWAAFARLAARVFNVTQARLDDSKIPDYDVHESASAMEIRLLRDLLLPNELPRLDGELLSNRIDQLLSSLDIARSAEDSRYHLVLRLGRESDLSRSVRDRSGLMIEMDDVESQLRWIEADLGEVVTLILVGGAADAMLFARGRELVYRLKQYKVGNEVPTWHFAFCENADDATSWRRSVAAHQDLPLTTIRLLPLALARETYLRMRGRLASWERQLQILLSAAPDAPSRETRLHRAFTLLHGLEIAFAAATVFPVAVFKDSREPGIIELAFRPSDDGKALSDALGLDPPMTRLKEGLDMEELGDGEGWTLTEIAHLGQAHHGDVELTYVGTRELEFETRFRFRTSTPTPVLLREGYLVPSSARGDFVQFRRRTQAIRLLKDHTELLQSLVDPRGRLLPTHDKVEHDDGYRALDEAKQRSLNALMAILPLYVLQGPPGVGKTYLVKDIVRRKLASDQSERLLITAQGNHALDHLLDELAGLWVDEPSKAPLAVRCRPKDDNAAEGPFDLHQMTNRLVESLAKSPLSVKASPSIQSRLHTLTGLAEGGGPLERRAIEGLVMRAANLVFATSNSADLERLIEEKGQFDWTIVEEAGKATGCELVTPLMLSHRRLLIGDHKQLPPFRAQELEGILAKPTAVRDALLLLPRLIDQTVRTLLDDDLLEFIEDEAQDLEPICAEATRILYLFQTLLIAELERQKRNPGGPRTADTLEVQHRMHPAICELVSQSFYGGNLVTSPTRANMAEKQAKWIVSKNAAVLPDSPFVWIDMPYQRSTKGSGQIESLPRFTNEDEVAEIVRVVAQLTVTEAAEKPPSLAILAPYARQVRQIRNAILENSGARTALAAFRPVSRGGEWCSTVDAFQGNEADVIIFSLVRNNRGATLRRALGFVGDQRRFNVLLSRARQRLIFVGSHEFLKTVAYPLGLESAPAGEFLRKFLEVSAGLSESQGRRVPGHKMGALSR